MLCTNFAANSIKPSECQVAFGMENGGITDSQITASSQYSSNLAPEKGRLQGAGAWSAGANNGNEWLQIDLGTQHLTVSRVATQGSASHNEWVTEYKLDYSYDGVLFQNYVEQGQTTHKVKYTFSSPEL